MNEIQTQIAIIGGGPAGLAAAHTLQEAGLSVVVLEKGSVAEHVAQGPTYMTYFSTPDLLELAGFPLIVTREKPTRQEYLFYLRRFVQEKKLDVRTGHEVATIEGEEGAFRVLGSDRHGDPFCVRAEWVVLATGAFASPQRLGVPGEDLSKVTHQYKEVHSYFGSKVLVVGGKNGAVETALELWRAGIEVSLCYRRAEFTGLKYWLGPDIENRIRKGEIKAWMPADVIEIRPRSVLLSYAGGRVEIENDFVVALTGYRPDPEFLGRMGVSTDAATGRPNHDPATLESERRGVFMAGVMLAGNVSGEIFIENSRTHGETILAALRGR